jgi:glycine hydroxymethyltransferase
MTEVEMGPIATWTDTVVAAAACGDEAAVARVAGEVAEIAARFPIPGQAA